MSGHSKWATTKRKKESIDAKRGSLFTKLGKIIAVAARDGADPNTNFKLRMAVDKAKSYSMPKDNIERAIAKGSGQGGEVAPETVIYEAYGPEGVALIIETVTDNKNRTVSEIKHILSKHGGTFGSSGSVMWQFQIQGIIYLKNEKITDEQELQLIELGADDILTSDDQVRVICALETLQQVKHNISESGQFEIDEVTTEYHAKDLLTPKTPEKIISLLEALDEDDDVNNVFTNADI